MDSELAHISYYYGKGLVVFIQLYGPTHIFNIHLNTRHRIHANMSRLHLTCTRKRTHLMISLQY